MCGRGAQGAGDVVGAVSFCLVERQGVMQRLRVELVGTVHRKVRGRRRNALHKQPVVTLPLDGEGNRRHYEIAPASDRRSDMTDKHVVAIVVPHVEGRSRRGLAGQQVGMRGGSCLIADLIYPKISGQRRLCPRPVRCHQCGDNGKADTRKAAQFKSRRRGSLHLLIPQIDGLSESYHQQG